MYYIGILIGLPSPRVMFCCIILEQCCYTCADTRLRTLISYVLLVSVTHSFSVEDTNAYLKPVVCFVLPVYTNGR